MRTIAIPLLVYKMTGSALNLGLTFALEMYSFGIFSLIGGSLADRIDRKYLMMSCDGVRFTIIAAFAVGYAVGWLTLPMLYAGIVIHSMCGAIFNGGQSSSIPYVVGKPRATHAVAALSATESAVNTVAPPVGGALFGLVGPLPALVINAVTYAASFTSLSAVRDLGPEVSAGFPRLSHVVDDVKLGFTFLFADRAMRIVTYGSLFGNFAGLIGLTAYVPFIKRDLGGTDLSVGIIFGAVGAGTVLGAILSPHIRLPFGKIMVAGYVWSAVCLPLAWTRSVIVAAIVFGLISIFSGVSFAQILGWRMRIIPEDMVGRVFGAVRVLVLVGTLPGALIGGLIADRYGARMAIVVMMASTYLINGLVAASPVIRNERR